MAHMHSMKGKQGCSLLHLLIQKYLPPHGSPHLPKRFAAQTPALEIDPGTNHTRSDDLIFSKVILDPTCRQRMECQDAQRLNLAGSIEIRSQDVEVLVEAGTFRDIDLSHCHALEDVPVAPHVTKLTLADCYNISPASLLRLLPNCPLLSSLNLRCCLQVTADAVVSLAKHYPQLVSLDLSGCNKVTDKSIRFLAQFCRHLVSLHLAGCSNVADGAVTALASYCQELANLDLSGCSQVINKGHGSFCTS